MTKNHIQESSKSISCPYCNHEGPHINKGYRRCKTVEPVLRYVCKACSRSFSRRTKTIMHGLRSSITTVVSALHVRSEGVGLRAAGRLVSRTHSTIAVWEERAKKLGNQLDRTVDIDFNVILESDELYTKVGKNHPSSESRGWTVCGIDRNSRYCTEHITGMRNVELFEKHTDKVLEFIGSANAHMVSDGEGRYASNIWKRKQAKTTLLGNKTGKKGRPKGSVTCLRKGIVVQRKVKGSQNKKSRRKRYETPLKCHPDSSLLKEKDVHANHSEAYNASLRRRSSVYRRKTNTYAKNNKGLDRALGAQRVIYNWIRPHHYHGKTPAEVLKWAKGPIKFEDFVMMKVS